jgi:hypothetical protein
MIRIFKKGEFWNEKKQSYVHEEEIKDSQVITIVQDNSGRVGYIESGCYEDFVTWIHDDCIKDMAKFRVERN